MTHWADRYVGLPYLKDGRDRKGVDCWGLVRLVWLEVVGFDMPAFVRVSDQAATIAEQSHGFQEINKDETQEFDAVIMNEDVRTKNGWKSAAVHIGVMVTPKLVLHVRCNTLSCIEPLKSLRPVSFRKGPRCALN